MFLSVAGQAAVHLLTMAAMVGLAHIWAAIPTAPPNPRLRREFRPNVRSNVVFLMSLVQSLSIIGVNFKGRPFKTGALEIPAFFVSMVLFAAFVVLCSLETNPAVNKLLGLAPFPNVLIKGIILLAMALDVALAHKWNQAMTRRFLPELAAAGGGPGGGHGRGRRHAPLSSLDAVHRRARLQAAGALVVFVMLFVSIG
mmetsp:Transcript_18512/g.32380  ORF Transcript_18512/g.32380 Transcript_18512/m.32380 type:complete len:198 (+) Transcript_18512:1-594(+)